MSILFLKNLNKYIDLNAPKVYTIRKKEVIYMNIGQRIKHCRTELNMSQRELAKRMGYLNHSTITKIEAGSVDIPQSKIIKFAQVLNTTEAFLMGWESIEEKSANNDGLSDNQKKLMDFVKTVPEDRAEMILKVIRSIVEAD